MAYRLTGRGVAVVIGATLAFLIVAGIVAAQDAAPHVARDYPPCITEDAPGPCYWDADTRGNGVGDSFFVSETGTVIYR